MRLNNTPYSDKLAIGGTATLDGTLDLTAVGTLTTNTWTLILTGSGVSGAFDDFDWPDGGAWAGAPSGGGFNYSVVKT